MAAVAFFLNRGDELSALLKGAAASELSRRAEETNEISGLEMLATEAGVIALGEQPRGRMLSLFSDYNAAAGALIMAPAALVPIGSFW